MTTRYCPEQSNWEAMQAIRARRIAQARFERECDTHHYFRCFQ